VEGSLGGRKWGGGRRVLVVFIKLKVFVVVFVVIVRHHCVPVEQEERLAEKHNH
jgi:hypothetical protein